LPRSAIAERGILSVLVRTLTYCFLTIEEFWQRRPGSDKNMLLSIEVHLRKNQELNRSRRGVRGQTTEQIVQ
jgi:hypothetical protein